MDELYEALRVAEAEGRKDDVARLIAYIDEQSAKQAPQQQDAREEVPRAIGAGAGAIAGAVVPGVVQSGLNRVAIDKLTPPPKVSVPHPSDMIGGAASNVDEALNKGVSNAFTQHTREAQVSQRQKSVDQVLKELKAKGVPVNPKILAEMPTQYAMPGSGLLVNADTAKQLELEQAARAAAAKQLPKDATVAQKFVHKVAPNLVENTGSFLKGVSEYKLPFGIKAGPLLGHILGGAGAGSQFVDAYNRGQQDDTLGQIISNVGGVGTAASVLPFPPIIRGAGAGVGLSAEAINAYRDALRSGRIVEGAPEDYSRTDAMGNMYAQGGLVYLAEGSEVKKPFENTVQQNIRSLVSGPNLEPQTLQEKYAEALKARMKARAGLAGGLTGVEPSGSGGPTLLNPLNR